MPRLPAMVLVVAVAHAVVLLPHQPCCTCKQACAAQCQDQIKTLRFLMFHKPYLAKVVVNLNNKLRQPPKLAALYEPTVRSVNGQEYAAAAAGAGP